MTKWDKVGHFVLVVTTLRIYGSAQTHLLDKLQSHAVNFEFVEIRGIVRS